MGREDILVATGRSDHDRLAVGAFLFVPVALAVVRLLMAVTGSTMPFTQLRPFYVVSAINIALAVIFFVGYRSRVVTAAVIMVTALLFLFSLLLGSWGLEHPDSFFDFVPGLVIVAGPVLGIVFVVSARHQRRRGAETTGRKRTRITVGTLVALFVVASVASGAKTALARRRLHIPPGASLVYAENNRFRPPAITGRAGNILLVAVVNRDPYAHLFTPERSTLLSNDYIGPNTVKVIRMRVTSEEHSDVFTCNVTGHDGMRGRIEIAPA